MMEKTGRVTPGKTPSEVSGKKSECVKSGRAVRKDENPPSDVKKKITQPSSE